MWQHEAVLVLVAGDGPFTAWLRDDGASGDWRRTTSINRLIHGATNGVRFTTALNPGSILDLVYFDGLNMESDAARELSILAPCYTIVRELSDVSSPLLRPSRGRTVFPLPEAIAEEVCSGQSYHSLMYFLMIEAYNSRITRYRHRPHSPAYEMISELRSRERDQREVDAMLGRIQVALEFDEFGEFA